MVDASYVISQMVAVGLSGLSEPDLVVDGNLHRFRPDWEPKARKKRAWYVLFDFHADSGEQLISGSFGWFKGADIFSFNVAITSDAALSAEENARFKQEQKQKRQLAELERKKEAKAAAKRAAGIWDKLPTKGHSPYLQQKKVASFGVRFSRGSIGLPVRDIDGSLSGLQFIDSDGNKKFLTGTIKKGRFCQLGDVMSPSGFMGIVEGYATGSSVRMATGWPVFVAFDAGNLLPVAHVVRQAYQLAKIVICGDDDLDNPANPGRTKAQQAAEAVNGIAIFPAKEVPA